MEDLVSFDRFAHHPVCTKFNNHLLLILNRSLCLGCTCLFVGLLVGIIPAFLTWFWHADWLFTWGFGIFCFLPTVIQTFRRGSIPKKLKIFSRTLLGIAVAFFLVSIIRRENLFEMALGVVIFWISMKFFANMRHRYSTSPCDSCTEGIYPFCSARLDDIRQINRNSQDEETNAPDFPMFISKVINQLENNDDEQIVQKLPMNCDLSLSESRGESQDSDQK